MPGLAQRLARLYVYFRRGHAGYTAFAMGIANFVVIQYALLIERFEPLKTLFPDIAVFALLFIAVYVPAAVLIGWLDLRRFVGPVELAIHAQVNPWMRDIATALYLLAEGRTEEAKMLLRKWAGLTLSSSAEHQED